MLSGFVLIQCPISHGRLAINFMVACSRDVAFHLNVRLQEGIVVRNSQIGGDWGQEERELSFNPFQEGQYFDVSDEWWLYLCWMFQMLQHYYPLFTDNTRCTKYFCTLNICLNGFTVFPHRSPYAVETRDLRCLSMGSICVTSSIVFSPSHKLIYLKSRETRSFPTYTSDTSIQSTYDQ